MTDDSTRVGQELATPQAGGEARTNALSRRTAIASVVTAGGTGYLAGTGLAGNSPVNTENGGQIFIGATLTDAVATAENSVPVDQAFKAVGELEKLAEVRLRTKKGSTLLFTQVTTDALAADSGFTLIKYKRPENGTFARSAAQMAEAGIIDNQLSIMNWVDPDLDRAIRSHKLEIDISAMVQQGLNHGAGSFPPGRYYFTSGLTLPNYAHLLGQAYQPGAPPDRATVDLRFCIRDGVAIQCGYNPTIENLYLTNCASSFDDERDRLTSSTASCLGLLDSAAIVRSSFALWAVAVSLGSSTYYLKTDMVEFNRCLVGYKAGTNPPYNLHIDKPISRKTRIFFDGGTAEPARNIKIFGGSIEGFSRVAQNFLDLACFGSYFETTTPHEGAIAIDGTTRGATVALYGNLIYMNHISKFVDMAGAEMATLSGSGNNFDGVGRADGCCYALPASGTASLAGDRLGAGHPPGLRYINSIDLAAKLGGVTFPSVPEGHAQAAYGGRAVIGRRGFVGVPNTSEPPDRPLGTTIMADGARWDPLGRRASGPYWVIWRGNRWASMSGD